jgi:predicted O-methyltransferase YrrM
VFLDADKKFYREYVDLLLGADEEGYTLLSDGAIIIADNTLWKGLVLNEHPAMKSQGSTDDQPAQSHRMQKIASKVHTFNEYVNNHPNLCSLLLPLRDGLTILTYSSVRRTLFEHK